jgi:hypothetical protein
MNRRMGHYLAAATTLFLFVSLTIDDGQHELRELMNV